MEPSNTCHAEEWRNVANHHRWKPRVRALAAALGIIIRQSAVVNEAVIETR
jgi:hypothetical protein